MDAGFSAKRPQIEQEILNEVGLLAELDQHGVPCSPAEPIAALYAQGKACHVGRFPQLEEQIL